MLHLLIVTAVSALAGLGWLISRWIKRDALSELIERRVKLLALHQRMKGAGLSAEDMARLERELTNEIATNPGDSTETRS